MLECVINRVKICSVVSSLNDLENLLKLFPRMFAVNQVLYTPVLFQLIANVLCCGHKNVKCRKCSCVHRRSKKYV